MTQHRGYSPHPDTSRRNPFVLVPAKHDAF
jgi:hypothetical protein